MPELNELPYENVAAPVDIDADAVFFCRDESMIGSRIFPGDAVFIKFSADAEDGEIVLVRLRDEYTLRKLYHFPDCTMLFSDCGKFPSSKLQDDEDMEVIGVAVKVMIDLV